jgi:Skp family chaperone for outer membrane proteins
VLNNFIKNSQDNASFVGKLNQEFTDELQQKQEKMRSDILDRVKAAVAEVSKKQGFSIVLNDEIAPYSANDLTPEALKAMNAKK